MSMLSIQSIPAEKHQRIMVAVPMEMTDTGVASLPGYIRPLGTFLGAFPSGPFNLSLGLT